MSESLCYETLNERKSGKYLDLDFARSQQLSFITQLSGSNHQAAFRLLGIDVTELADQESLPWACFIGDTAVVNHGVAIMARLHNEGRQREVDRMKIVLRREGLHVIPCDDPSANLSADDVLFTGSETLLKSYKSHLKGYEYIVGLSQYTNLAGVTFLAKHFPEYRIRTVQHSELRCYYYFGKEIESKVEQRSRYQTLTISHEGHSSCLWINKDTICISRHDCKCCFNVRSRS
ncbi:hypothetical protein ACOME3_010064 [Neoechinorhynchus agilis]